MLVQRTERVTGWAPPSDFPRATHPKGTRTEYGLQHSPERPDTDYPARRAAISSFTLSTSLVLQTHFLPLQNPCSFPARRQLRTEVADTSHQVATSTVLPAGGCFSGGLTALCRVSAYSSISSSQLTPLLSECKDHHGLEVTHCRVASWLLWPASHQASASPLRSRGTSVMPSARACSTPHFRQSWSSIENCSQDRLHGGVERGLRRLISPNRATRP